MGNESQMDEKGIYWIKRNGKKVRGRNACISKDVWITLHSIALRKEKPMTETILEWVKQYIAGRKEADVKVVPELVPMKSRRKIRREITGREVVSCTVYMVPELLKEVRHIAAEKDLDMSGVLVMAFEHYLVQHKM